MQFVTSTIFIAQCDTYETVVQCITHPEPEGCLREENIFLPEDV